MDRHLKKHPSYGMLSFSRCYGGEKSLFGSSILHSNTIRLTLREGSVERHLNRDWHYGGKQLFEVEMSYSQFAELISNMNSGDGVPVTLKSVMGETKEQCPFENKRMEFANDFKTKVREIQQVCNNLIKETKELFETKKPLNKSEKEQILSQLECIKREVNSNIPFIADSFNEQMDKTVLEAKGEVEAFVLNKIDAIANKAIAENPDSLLGEMNNIKLLNEEE
jgi:hypothetical protein